MCSQNSGQQSVTAVLFQGGEKLISAGAMDGSIKIWDLRKTYSNLKADPLPFHTFPYPEQGVRRKHGKLLVTKNHRAMFSINVISARYFRFCQRSETLICCFWGKRPLSLVIHSILCCCQNNTKNSLNRNSRICLV